MYFSFHDLFSSLKTAVRNLEDYTKIDVQLSKSAVIWKRKQNLNWATSWRAEQKVAEYNDAFTFSDLFPMEGQVERPIVFFDISIGDVPVGRMKMELYSDIVPKTAENFRQVCKSMFIKVCDLDSDPADCVYVLCFQTTLYGRVQVSTTEWESMLDAHWRVYVCIS